jgi:hypothetical protein
VTYNPTRRRGALLPLEPSEEEGLAALLRKAERKAYTLAHSHDIGGYPDRAHGMSAISQGIGEVADHLDILIHSSAPISKTPPLGLRLRALLLRERLTRRAWVNATAAPLVPERSGLQQARKKFRKQTYGKV